MPANPGGDLGPAPVTRTENPNPAVAARRAWLTRNARLRSLSDVDRDIIRLANNPGFKRWLEQIHDIGGCANPIYLSGWTRTVDPSTGEVLLSYSTSGEPGERLALRCGNRRATRCGPCSRLYQGDTFQLVRSGLLGGKSVPEHVGAHPRLFVTLTAPSFGAVHHTTPPAQGPCRRRRGICQHGARLGCGLVHSEDDPLIGTPLCVACYDYTEHVLWHAHAGRLWDRFTTGVRRHLASAVGIARTRLRDHLVVSFAKVAEYQKRGAIHFHAVVRLDGPEPYAPPPGWATPELLDACVRAVAASAWVDASDCDAYGSYRLRFGDQLYVREIAAFGSDGQALTDDAVAGYVAKYVTKSAEVAGAIDYPITSAESIAHLPVSTHVRALIGACWKLGALPESEPLRLRAWAHMLGYRGHCLTKTRAYSTTYGELRAVRARHRCGPPLPGDLETVTESAWRYIGHGYTPGEAELAAGIADNITQNREIAREALADENAGGWSDGEASR